MQETDGRKLGNEASYNPCLEVAQSVGLLYPMYLKVLEERGEYIYVVDINGEHTKFHLLSKREDEE
jgi:hypothetical protein